MSQLPTDNDGKAPTKQENGPPKPSTTEHFVSGAGKEDNTIANSSTDKIYYKKKVNWPSWITAICTGFIVIITGFYTYYASEQAAQMEKTVRIASDTSIRQLRAYVIVDRVGINGVITNSQPTVTVEFKNSGQTPAYDVTSWISIGLSKFPLTYSIPEEINFPTMKGSKDIITSGGKVLLPATMSSPLTIEEIDQLNTGTHAIYFIGKIIYKDAFGIERFTKFKFFCNKKPGGVP